MADDDRRDRGDSGLPPARFDTGDDACEQAGVTCHYLPVDENTPYQFYARDSFFMSPYGAVICQLANPRTQNVALALEKDPRKGGIAVLMVTGRGRAALEDVIPSPPPDTDAVPAPGASPMGLRW